jgi:hypothetical protein
MSLPPSEAMRVVADGILRWVGTSHIGATDVLIWWGKPGYVHVALRGPALRLTHGLQAVFNNKKGWLDLALQAAVGLPAQRANYGGPDMQTMEDGDPSIDSVLEGIEQVVHAAVQQHGDPEPTYEIATPMPDQGSPWSPQNDPTPYYSARKKKVLVTRKPEWLVKVDADADDKARGHETTLGADVCAVLPRVEKCGGSVVGMFPERSHFEFLVTHSLTPGSRGQQDLSAAAGTIAQCGGLLLPSLAIGIVPATIFGTLVLVCAPDLPLLGLRPYKARGAWPVTVYGTDAWTVVTREVLSRGARELFGELTGNRRVGYNDHFWVLGAPQSLGGMMHEEDVVPLAGTKQLASKVLKRAKQWPRAMDQAAMDQRKEQLATKADYYPYVEAKVNGILALSCFPLAVLPACRKKAYVGFLQRAGFKGDVITIDAPEQAVLAIEGQSMSGKRDELSWHYAWACRDAVLAYAAQSPNARVFAVVEA